MQAVLSSKPRTSHSSRTVQTRSSEMNSLLSQYSTELKKAELEDAGAAMRIEELERMNMVNLWFMPMVSQTGYVAMH